MNSSFSDIYYGLWWLPNGDEIYGVLNIQGSQSPYLEVLAPLNGEEPAIFGQNKFTKHPLVIGKATSIQTNEDYIVQIYKLQSVKKASEILFKERYYFDKALFTTNHQKEPGDTFKSLSMTSPTWREWSRRVSENSHLKMSDHPSFGYNINYEQPGPINLYRSANLEIEIYYLAKYHDNNEGETILSEEPYIKIEFPTHRNLQGSLEKKQSLERLFMVLWERHHAFSKNKFEGANGNVYDLYQQKAKIWHDWYARYKFKDFTNDSGSIFNKWFDLEKTHSESIQSFFFAFIDAQLEEKYRFLGIVFALEQYHKEKFTSHYLLSKKDQKMYNETMEVVRKNGAVTSWLKRVLNKERSVSLKQRLTDLVDYLADKEGINLDKKIIKRCQSSRHYLVHLDAKHKDEMLSQKEIMDVNDHLSLLMLRLLKQDIG